MKPLLSPLSGTRNGGRPLDSFGIEQPVEPAVADRGRRHERERQRIQRHRERHAVEVPAASNLRRLAQQDDRVIRDRVRFDREDAVDVPSGVARRPMHLWRAAQGICVLHEVRRVSMRLADRRSGEQRAEVRRRCRLPRVGTQRMQPLVEGRVGSEQRLDRHRRDHVRRAEESHRPRERHDPDREHALRAVDEREALLRAELERRELRTCERVGRRFRPMLGEHRDRARSTGARDMRAARDPPTRRAIPARGRPGSDRG